MKLNHDESIWRESLDDGVFCFHLELRGLLNQETNLHDWIRIGTFGTREAAEKRLEGIRQTHG